MAYYDDVKAAADAVLAAIETVLRDHPDLAGGPA